MFDYLLLGGLIVDGSGAPAYYADIGIEHGRISAIGSLRNAPAEKILDIDDFIVTPGFVDIHRHADAAVFRPGFGSLELAQGLTTIVNGNCGLSVSPLSPERRNEVLHYLEPVVGPVPDRLSVGSLSEYLSSVPPLPIHTGMLAGAGTIRASVCGYGTLHPSDEDYRSIHASMENALRDGALGISLGLGYAPECFYSTEELIRALSPISHTDVPLTVHMRMEGSGVIESVREMLTVAKTLRCPLHISHLKAMGKANMRTKIPQALQLMTEARNDGLDVTCDVYPYTAGSTQLMHILPPEFLEGGPARIVDLLRCPEARDALRRRISDGTGFDNIAQLAGWDGIFVTSLSQPENRKYIGKSVQEIAELTGLDPLDACCELLVSENCSVTMIDFMACEEDITEILRSPLSCLISDSTYPTTGLPHPRVYGTFTHLLTRFVGELGVLSLEAAVNKMTGAPARALRLGGKGTITTGADADLCVFIPDALRENATYTEPRRESSGMEYVFVAGAPAVWKGRMTSERTGTVIRRV